LGTLFSIPPHRSLTCRFFPSRRNRMATRPPCWWAEQSSASRFFRLVLTAFCEEKGWQRNIRFLGTDAPCRKSEAGRKGRRGIAVSRTAMVRARAGIAYTLAEAMANGHCGLAEDELPVALGGSGSGAGGHHRLGGLAHCPFDQVSRRLKPPMRLEHACRERRQ
jgi:hypothetical protein